MTRFLTGNVWVDEVFYRAGMADTEVGSAASSIGDHLWRSDAGEDAVASAPAVASTPVPEVEPSGEDDGAGEGRGQESPDPIAVPEEAAAEGSFLGDAGDDSGAVEPEPTGGVAAPQPPRRSGPGSSETAWRAYAKQVGVHVDDANDRAEVIATIEAAGKPV